MNAYNEYKQTSRTKRSCDKKRNLNNFKNHLLNKKLNLLI